MSSSASTTRTYSLDRLWIPGVVLGRFDMDPIRGVTPAQLAQTQPTIGETYEVQPNFSKFERPMYLVEEELQTQTSSTTGASTESSGNSPGTLIMHDDPSRQVYKGEPEETGDTYAVFVEQKDEEGNVKYAVIPVDQCYSFSKEYDVVQRSYDEVEVAMKDNLKKMWRPRANPVDNFLKNKSSGSVAMEEGEKFEDVKLKLRTGGTKSETGDTLAPDSKSEKYTKAFDDIGNEVDYDDVIDDDDLDTGEVANEREQDVDNEEDEEDEGNEEDLQKAIADNASLAPATQAMGSASAATGSNSAAAASSSASQGSAPKEDNRVDGIHHYVKAVDAEADEQQTSSSRRASKSTRKRRDLPDIQYVDVNSENENSRKKAKTVDAVSEIRHELREYFNRQSGPVSAQALKKHKRKLVKKFGGGNIEKKIDNIVVDISKRHAGRDGKSYYLLK